MYNQGKDGNKFPKVQGGYRPGNSQANVVSPEQFYKNAGYDKKWIEYGADENLPRFAEILGAYMATNDLTNSKIRSVYGEIKRIQMGEFDKEKASFYLLKPKVAYALGRDKNNRGLQLFKKVFDEASSSVKDQKTYKNFCNLIEAILAYHKANGGKD